MEYYSAIKNEIMPFAATWIQLEIIKLSEVSQKEDKYHMTSLICVLKFGTNEPIYRRNRLTDMKNRFVVAKGVGERSGMDLEFGVHRCKLLYLEWIDNKILLYSMGKCIQSHLSWDRPWGKIVFKKECVCIYVCVCVCIYIYLTYICMYNFAVWKKLAWHCKAAII